MHPSSQDTCPVGQRNPKINLSTRNPGIPHYTTPTPRNPILGEFSNFTPKFERDFCIQTPYFRWTPLPEAIPSRRNLLIFAHFWPDLPTMQA